MTITNATVNFHSQVYPAAQPFRPKDEKDPRDKRGSSSKPFEDQKELKKASSALKDAHEKILALRKVRPTSSAFLEASKRKNAQNAYAGKVSRAKFSRDPFRTTAYTLADDQEESNSSLSKGAKLRGMGALAQYLSRQDKMRLQAEAQALTSKAV